MALRFAANLGLGQAVPRAGWRPLLVSACVLPALVVSCRPSPATYGRLENATEIFFAQESAPACDIEASNGESAPALESQWVKVPTNALTNRQFAVVQKQGLQEKGGKWT